MGISKKDEKYLKTMMHHDEVKIRRMAHSKNENDKAFALWVLEQEKKKNEQTKIKAEKDSI